MLKTTSKSAPSKILLLYTGGTIGMRKNDLTGELAPVAFDDLHQELPQLAQLNLKVSTQSTRRIIDSSNMQPEVWVELAELIAAQYENFDGFVILHGTDTMAYTASALAFMFHGLNKPVILTGSQLPLGTLRTDGKENLITALEIAGAKLNNKPVVSEVCIYFERCLLRGTRAKKQSAEWFKAFDSPNYPVLAEAGIDIRFNFSALKRWNVSQFSVNTSLDLAVGILFLFPGIPQKSVEAILHDNQYKAIILLTFGSGNAPTFKWFLDAVNSAIQKGVYIINLTQCATGSVRQGRYETSYFLQQYGVISAGDMTLEATLAKLMVLLPQPLSKEQFITAFQKSLRGELTI